MILCRRLFIAIVIIVVCYVGVVFVVVAVGGGGGGVIDVIVSTIVLYCLRTCILELFVLLFSSVVICVDAAICVVAIINNFYKYNGHSVVAV